MAKRTQDPWTPEADKIMREHYPTVGIVGTAEMLRRSEFSVRARAKRLGLKVIVRPEMRPDLRKTADSERREAIEMLGHGVLAELRHNPNQALHDGFIRALQTESPAFFKRYVNRPLVQFFEVCEKLAAEPNP